MSIAEIQIHGNSFIFILLITLMKIFSQKNYLQVITFTAIITIYKENELFKQV